MALQRFHLMGHKYIWFFFQTEWLQSLSLIKRRKKCFFESFWKCEQLISMTLSPLVMPLSHPYSFIHSKPSLSKPWYLTNGLLPRHLYHHPVSLFHNCLPPSHLSILRGTLTCSWRTWTPQGSNEIQQSWTDHHCHKKEMEVRLTAGKGWRSPLAQRRAIRDHVSIGALPDLQETCRQPMSV